MSKLQVSTISDPNNDNTAISIANDGSVSFPNGGSFGGKLLQVVSVWDETQRTSTGSWVNALTGTITPSSTSSKVLIVITAQFSCSTDTYGGTRLARSGTVIGSSTQTSGGASANQYFLAINHRDGDAQWEAEMISGSYMDSPSTTSALTYTFAFNKHYGTAITQNRPYATNNAAYHWNTPSTMMLMEIGA